MNQQELERSILDAHSRGDRATLKQLQSEYRALGVERVSGPGSIQIIERGTTRPTSATTAARSSSRTSTASRAPSAVFVSSNAHYELRNELRPHEVTHEVGAWCFGRVDGPTLRIETFHEAWTEASRSHVRLDLDEAIRARDERYRGLGLELVGDLHTHPTITPASTTDLDTLVQTADDLGRLWPYWASLIWQPVRMDLYGRNHVVETPVWIDAEAAPRLEGWICEPRSTPRRVPVLLEEAL